MAFEVRFGGTNIGFDASFGSSEDLNATFGETIEVHVADYYEGPYRATPTNADITVPVEEKTMLEDFVVEAIPGDWVGEDVPRRGIADLTVSGASVTAPAGYYGNDATKSVDSGSAATPALNIEANPSISIDANGKITASVTKSESVTPIVTPGYVSGGTAGTITFAGSATQQMTKRSSADLTASGDTVTAPAGYYPGASSKAVSAGSATTPATTVTANPSISVDASGLITATASATKSVTPTVSAGYVSAGTAGTVTVTGSATSQLDTQGAATITPTTSQQTAVAAGKYTTGAVVVDAIPPTQTKSATYTPTTAQQTDTITADAGYYGLEEVDVTVNAMPNGVRGSQTIISGWASGGKKTYTISYPNATSGYYDASVVSTPGTVELTRQTETVAPTESEQVVTPTNTYYYLEKVTVDPIPPQYIVPTGDVSITANGTGIDVAQYATATVAVPAGTPNLQSKTKSYTPTESAQSETVSADAGYDGLSSVAVSVGAISPTYVGSGITQRSSSDLTASGATVTAPAGYYASAASKAVASGVVVPSTAISSSSGATATVSSGVLTVSKTVNNVPQVTTAGYVTSGTLGNTDITLRADATTCIPENIKSGISMFGVTGTYTGGGGGSGLTLLGTLAVGSISTSSNTDTDTGKTITVKGIYDYDLLVCQCSVDTKVNNRHVCSTRLCWLTASSAIGTKDGAAFATATWNVKLSSSGVATSRQSTNAYGVYAKAATVSAGSTGDNGQAVITIYRRYNSTQTGTINGSYTMRVYGVKLYDLLS